MSLVHLVHKRTTIDRPLLSAIYCLFGCPADEKLWLEPTNTSPSRCEKFARKSVYFWRSASENCREPFEISRFLSMAVVSKNKILIDGRKSVDFSRCLGRAARVLSTYLRGIRRH